MEGQKNCNMTLSHS